MKQVPWCVLVIEWKRERYDTGVRHQRPPDIVVYPSYEAMTEGIKVLMASKDWANVKTMKEYQGDPRPYGGTVDDLRDAPDKVYDATTIHRP